MAALGCLSYDHMYSAICILGGSMGFENSGYRGDAEYSICCTGDAVTGDEVRFDRAEFGGTLRKPTFLGFQRITGRIVADSYGADKQQHTFTLLLADGAKTMIKGRNLYKQGVWRKPWADENDRRTVAAEKHGRGDIARASRDARRLEAGHVY